MSYANGTTHYNLPQTVGTDKRDWFDTNQAFADVDEALYGAVNQSESTATALTALTSRVNQNETDITTLQSNQATDEASITALQTTVATNTSNIADVRADVEDMICAYNEGTATVSTHAYAIGDYFIYNDVLYRATSAIAVGDTIVPNTNCEATNVATELGELDVPIFYSSFDVSVTGNGVKTYTELLNELFALVDTTKITQKSVLVDRTTYQSNPVDGVFQLSYNAYDATCFGRTIVSSTGSVSINNYRLQSSSIATVVRVTSDGTVTYSDIGSTAASSGETIGIIY